MAVLGAIISLLNVSPIRTDVDRPAMLGSWRIARQAGEVRDLGERQVDFAACARIVQMLHRVDKLRGQLGWIHEAKKGQIGVKAGDDATRPVLDTVLE